MSLPASRGAQQGRRHVLGFRNRNTDEAVAYAQAHIEELVTPDQMAALVGKTLAEVCQVYAGYRRPALAWSGGKDSLVLADMLQRAGLVECGVLGLTLELEYPAMDAWYAHNTPSYITTIREPHHTWVWLVEHQDLIFPRTSQACQRWRTWQGAQDDYCAEQGCDLLVLGRRKQDQNYCGPNTPTGVYRPRGKATPRYNPIRLWSHEDVLAYHHYFGVVLPPLYSWHNGFCEGTHPWPMRMETVDDADGWAQVASIDVGIVQRAAHYGISSAQDWLANPAPIKTYGFAGRGAKRGL